MSRKGFSGKGGEGKGVFVLSNDVFADVFGDAGELGLSPCRKNRDGRDLSLGACS